MGNEQMYAAMRPYFSGHEVREGRWVAVEPADGEDQAGNVAGDPIHQRAAEILNGLAPGDRMAVMSYAMAELKRVGACGRH